MPGPLPGPGGRSVAVQDLRLVLVPRGCRPVGVEDQGPALLVDHDLVVEETKQDAVPGAGLAAVLLVLDVVHVARRRGLVAAARPTGTYGPAGSPRCGSRPGPTPEYPMSSGRLGPPSRTPSCRRRKKPASPPGPDSRSTALPITACSSAARAAVVSAAAVVSEAGVSGAAVVSGAPARRQPGGAGPVPRTTGPDPPRRPR